VLHDDRPTKLEGSIASSSSLSLKPKVTAAAALAASSNSFKGPPPGYSVLAKVTTLPVADHLNVASDPSIAKILKSYGSIDESITYSDGLEKISDKKHKTERRVVMVTNKALYCLIPSKWSEKRDTVNFGTLKLDWRVELNKISRIYAMRTGERLFAVAVPSDRDYVLTLDPKNEVLNHIQKNYEALVGQALVPYWEVQGIDYFDQEGKRRVLIQ